MTSVLIIHEQAELANALAGAFRSNGATAHRCASLDAGLVELSRGAIDLVACDVSARAAAIPAAVRRSAPRAAVLGVLDVAQAADPSALACLSTSTVLRPPFAPTHVAAAARAARPERRGFQGNVTGLSLLEVLQMFHLAKRSATLELDGSTAGRVFFANGDVIHAETASERGFAAFATLLRAAGGRFRSTPAGPVSRTIDAPFDALMMAALTQGEHDAAENPIATDDDAPFAGLDALHSWSPCAQSDLAPLDVVIPAAPSLPRGLEPVAAPPSTLGARWLRSNAMFRPPEGLRVALVVHLETGAQRALVGLGDAAAGGAVAALAAQLGAFACGGPTGVFDAQFGASAAAVLWDRGVGEALLLGVDARTGAGPFRAYVSALAARILGDDAALAQAAEGAQ